MASADLLGEVSPADLYPALCNQAIARGLMAGLRSRLATVNPGVGALAFLATLQRWDGRTVVPTGWPARRWQRACKYQLGVTPKLLQRLVRLHQSAQIGLTNPVLLTKAPAPGWADHALAAGYSDQSHMLRDYRELAGLTPARAVLAGHATSLQALHIGANALVPRLLPGVGRVSDLSNT